MNLPLAASRAFISFDDWISSDLTTHFKILGYDYRNSVVNYPKHSKESS